jgi:hypothetical protein
MTPFKEIPTKLTENDPDREFFEILAAAQKEYQGYVDLAELAEREDSEFEKVQLQAIQRDMSHPLSIVIH